MTKSTPVFLDSLEPLLERFDGFLIDLWGVLHDGERALAGSRGVLARLQHTGKRVVLLSNSGRRADSNAVRLARLGFSRSCYQHIVTSGEVTWQGLRARTEPPFCDLGSQCLFCSSRGDRSAIDGLDLTVVDDARAAEFVLLSGIDARTDPVERWRQHLREAAAHALPMLCSNPDMIAIVGAREYPGPGVLADYYASLGGNVHYIGKPWPGVYRAALARLGLPLERVVAIGDSAMHDIAGAQRMGIASVLVLSGVHRQLRQRPRTQVLEALARAAQPDWIIASLGAAGRADNFQ